MPVLSCAPPVPARFNSSVISVSAVLRWMRAVRDMAMFARSSIMTLAEASCLLFKRRYVRPRRGCADRDGYLASEPLSIVLGRSMILALAHFVQGFGGKIRPVGQDNCAANRVERHACKVNQ